MAPQHFVQAWYYKCKVTNYKATVTEKLECCYTHTALVIVLHYPTRDLLRRKLSLLKAGSHYLHYHLKRPEHRKNPSPAVTQTPGNMQSRHASREPHTNWDGIFLCVLPYLTSVTSCGSILYYTITIGTCLEGN